MSAASIGLAARLTGATSRVAEMLHSLRRQVAAVVCSFKTNCGLIFMREVARSVRQTSFTSRLLFFVEITFVSGCDRSRKCLVVSAKHKLERSAMLCVPVACIVVPRLMRGKYPCQPYHKHCIAMSFWQPFSFGPELPRILVKFCHLSCIGEGSKL